MKDKNMPKQVRHTGVFCPWCSGEMLYSDSMVLATDPPQRYMQCSSCKYSIKIIKRKSCKECPYRRVIATPYLSHYYCFIKQIEEGEILSSKFGGVISMKEIKDINGIPDWCPLEGLNDKR